MMLKAGIMAMALIGATVGGAGAEEVAGAAAADEIDPGPFIALLETLREAVEAGDYARFAARTIQPGPADPEHLRDHFDALREPILAFMPDPQGARVLRMQARADEVLLVLRTGPDNPEFITLEACRFHRRDGIWKLDGRFRLSTLSRSDEDSDRRRIEAELDGKAMFRFGDLHRSVPEAPAPPR
ncbi:MAG: hypothetical protein ACPGU7_14660 [Gammaproteobacteria bacterium]